MFPTEDLINELRVVRDELALNAPNSSLHSLDSLFESVRKQNEAILKYFEIKSRQPV